MMPICKKFEFVLCHVCLQYDKQTTFKMLFSEWDQIEKGYAMLTL